MSNSTRMVMYGAGVSGGIWDPDEMRRRAEELRRSLPSLPSPSFSITQNPVTKTDLDAAVARIETQMLALLAEMQKQTELLRKALRKSPKKRGAR